MTYPARVLPFWNSRRSASGPPSFRIAFSRSPSSSLVQFSTWNVIGRVRVDARLMSALWIMVAVNVSVSPAVALDPAPIPRVAATPSTAQALVFISAPPAARCPDRPPQEQGTSGRVRAIAKRSALP